MPLPNAIPPNADEDFVHLVVTDASGDIFVHPQLRMAASDGKDVRPVRLSECVPVPEGSDFYSMPGRIPLGWDDDEQGPVAVEETPEGDDALPLSVFLAPAWTRICHPATYLEENAPSLPLYAYSAVGAAPDGTPVSLALRVDPDRRQDPPLFDMDEIQKQVGLRQKELPKNRLVTHISHCALAYNCRAAQNYFLSRWEAPIPISRKCNSRCIGCISLQKDTGKIASHDRIGFALEPAEVAELTLDHISRVENAVVSFGQGCEGEPLLYADEASEALRIVRAKTDAGTLHLNSNASKPDGLQKLIDGGLDSLRVSLNSARAEVYNPYYRPTDYSFDDVRRSMEIACEAGLFVSLNLLVFPGVSDTQEELDALLELHRAAPFQMVQWRNLNVDPDEYLDRLEDVPFSEAIGMDVLMDRLEAEIPGLKRGYYNPCKESFGIRDNS